MRRFPFPLLLASVLGLGLAPATEASQGASAASGSVESTVATGQRGAARVKVRGHFNLATFNVLGHSHTNGRGDRFASSARRMRITVKAFQRRNVHVVALQEFEEQQWRTFRRLTDGRYGVWAHERHIANAVAWRTKKFAFVRARTIGVPYFHGNVRQMPVVFLRHRATGQTMAFTSFHNPVTSKRRPGNDKWRARAIKREILLAQHLRKRGIPAFLSGDFNERSERWQCRVARRTNMVTAGNGSGRGGSCKTPDRMRIDWIFGSNGVIFSRYIAVESRRVQLASDHPLIIVNVR